MAARVDSKRRPEMAYRKRQLPDLKSRQQEYKQRLNFYIVPPTADITLEEFEEWAINRLKVLAELEACSFRNRGPEETAEYMKPILEKYMPLGQNSSRSSTLQDERKRDHYSHFILRLAFSSTEDLRRRFTRLETQLFRLRWQNNDIRDRQDFVESLSFEWEKVSEAEKREFAAELEATDPFAKKDGDNGWFKVDWEKVPELVESRRVFLRRGKAFVPVKEQQTMVISEFSRRLDLALEQTARALPRLDEDERLLPILKHLSQNFTAPGATYDDAVALPGAQITAASIDTLSAHFPLCMRNLHLNLRKNSHLKHYGRLQYTLFLKGLGLGLEDCLQFWRSSFKLMTDEKFDKEHRYNVRHAYGDVGGDANRRGKGYTPYSCQKLLSEAPPGPGQYHGCPYKSYGPDNLATLLQAVGVNDRPLLKEVRDDCGKQRYHIACNKVFEWGHKGEIKRVKDEGAWGVAQLDTILHPNEYFARSWKLKNLGRDDVGGGGGGGTGAGAGAAGGPKREVVMDES